MESIDDVAPGHASNTFGFWRLLAEDWDVFRVGSQGGGQGSCMIGGPLHLVLRRRMICRTVHEGRASIVGQPETMSGSFRPLRPGLSCQRLSSFCICPSFLHPRCLPFLLPGCPVPSSQNEGLERGSLRALFLRISVPLWDEIEIFEIAVLSQGWLLWIRRPVPARGSP